MLVQLRQFILAQINARVDNRAAMRAPSAIQIVLEGHGLGG